MPFLDLLDSVVYDVYRYRLEASCCKGHGCAEPNIPQSEHGYGMGLPCSAQVRLFLAYRRNYKACEVDGLEVAVLGFFPRRTACRFSCPVRRAWDHWSEWLR